MVPKKTKGLLLVAAALLALIPGSGTAAQAGSGRAVFLRAVQDLRSGRLDAACRGLREALDSDPESLAARFYLGECLYHLGRLDEAQTQLSEVARRAPAMPATHYYLGRLAYDRRQLGQAFTQLHLAESLDPNSSMTHYYLGLVYQSHGQPDAAVSEFDKALALEPRLALAAYNLAWIRFHVFGQTLAAESALKHGFAGQPDPALKKSMELLKMDLDRAK